MNKIDFTQPGGFPLDTNALDFLQAAFSSSINALSALGGDNYIVSGCVVNGNNVSPGWMVIAGELLPFRGGIAQSKVLVLETKDPVGFQDLIARDVIVTRFVSFGTGLGEILFSSLTPVKTLLSVKAELEAIQLAISSLSSVPSGVIVAWGGEIDTIPVGWHLCDGSSVGIPDLRSMFILGAGFRPVGRKGGSETTMLTIDQMPKHSHTFRMASNGIGNGSVYPGVTDNSSHLKGNGTTDDTGGYTAAHDNMPPYYTLAYIIKL